MVRRRGEKRVRGRVVFYSPLVRVPVCPAVPYRIAVECGAKVVFARLHGVHKAFGVHQVGVRVAAAKVGQRFGVDHGVRWGAELLDKDAMGVRACDA